MPDGRRYTVDANTWSTRLAIATDAGEPLVRYRIRLDAMKLSSVMEIEPRARGIEETSWMAMLGWYIATQLHRDSALRGVGDRRWPRSSCRVPAVYAASRGWTSLAIRSAEARWATSRSNDAWRFIQNSGVVPK